MKKQLNTSNNKERKFELYILKYIIKSVVASTVQYRHRIRKIDHCIRWTKVNPQWLKTYTIKHTTKMYKTQRKCL